MAQITHSNGNSLLSECQTQTTVCAELQKSSFVYLHVFTRTGMFLNVCALAMNWSRPVTVRFFVETVFSNVITWSVS
jgi:hypothetical protein